MIRYISYFLHFWLSKVFATLFPNVSDPRTAHAIFAYLFQQTEKQQPHLKSRQQNVRIALQDLYAYFWRFFLPLRSVSFFFNFIEMKRAKRSRARKRNLIRFHSIV